MSVASDKSKDLLVLDCHDSLRESRNDTFSFCVAELRNWEMKEPRNRVLRISGAFSVIEEGLSLDSFHICGLFSLRTVYDFEFNLVVFI